MTPEQQEAIDRAYEILNEQFTEEEICIWDLRIGAPVPRKR